MTATSTDETLRIRAGKLGFYGLLASWEELGREPWLPRLLDCEEEERGRRSLERRIKHARLGSFKPLADFDWKWPTEIDREAIEDLFSFGFIREAANVILVGPNGVGKTMIAQNLAHQALLHGYTVRFTNASAMLADLAAQDSASALERRIRRYCRAQLLVIDEIGYLSYDNRYADLLFEVVNRRYQKQAVLITTNRRFQEWNEVFPNAACVVTLIDRLIHKAEVIKIQGESYRLKEANERAAGKRKAKKGGER